MPSPASEKTGSFGATAHEPDGRDPGYLDLDRNIRELKAKVEPLQDEIITTPMWPVVARIMSLSTESGQKAEEIRQEVEECKRLLSEMAFDLVSQIIAKPDPSKVFRIVNNTNIFKKMVRKAVGKKIQLPSGEEVEITPQLAKFLTRFEFSIGTPPVTKKGMETVEKILFGGQLGDIYGFRNILGTEIDVFDRFMKVVDRMVEQSTHYTTADEKKQFERGSRDFVNMEGLRGFAKTTVSGSADTAVRMIKEHLFSQYKNGSTPLTEVEVGDLSDQDEMAKLVSQMEDQKTHMFIVRVKSVPHNIFATDVLKEEWRGILGRLIIVEDSDTSARASVTMVHSLNPEVTEILSKFHIKDSGTQSNTQLNLRTILEGFSTAEIGRLKERVDEKIRYFESQGTHTTAPRDARKKEWVVDTQKDYVSLQRFKRFLEFLEKIKNGSIEDLRAMQQAMIGEEEGLEMNYFFKDLPEDEYRCIYVPQGGGRRELGLIGKYHLGRHRRKVEEFQKKYLDPENPIARAKLASLKATRNIPEGTTEAEHRSLDRALESLRSPDQAIRDFEGEESPLLEGVVDGIREKIRQAIHKGTRDVESIVKEILIGSLDHILGSNMPGAIKKRLATLLGEANLSSASKIFERAPFRTIANKFRAFEGLVRRFVEEELELRMKKTAAGVRRSFEPKTLERIERMLNDVQTQGAFEPHLIMAEMGWSFGDVLVEDDFPTQNYINIDMDRNGNLALQSLEDHLEKMQEDLEEFPELFELYCSSILLVFNDPHNPTAKVAGRETKLKILDIASKYDLSIMADEAYHKMIKKDLKEEQGDVPLATFYEQNRARFPKPIRIYSSLPSTKWGMGAGRRTGNIITNDIQQHPIVLDNGHETNLTFEEFARQSTDGVNTVSLFMDIATLKTGLAVKKVCKALEKTLLNPAKSPAAVIDELLAEMHGEFSSPEFQGAIYFKLMQARNDLDRLMIREANPLVVRQFVSDLISELKELRLDKQTRKDTEQRVKAGIKAVNRLSEEFPGLNERYIKPEGPFYLCVMLDESGVDSGLKPFAEAIAKARKIDGVSVGKGDIRFAFGGMLDGTPESYELLSVVFETDLRLILQYWKKFKEIRAGLETKKDSDPTYHALAQLFPGGEQELAGTLEDKKKIVYFSQLLNEIGPQENLKKILKGLEKSKGAPTQNNSNNEERELGDMIDAVTTEDLGLAIEYWKKFKQLKATFEEQGDLDPVNSAIQELLKQGDLQMPKNIAALKVLIGSLGRYKEKGRALLVFQTSSDASKYVSTIQPDSQASIVTIRGVACKSMLEFIDSKPFKTLFDYHILKIRSKIPHFKNLTDGEVLGNYGALKFQEKVKYRRFKKGEKELFAQIAIEVAKAWFSDDTTKVLAESFTEGSLDMKRKALLGTERVVSEYIKEFLRVFITKEQEDSLKIKPSFQVGYQAINGVRAGKKLQPWMKMLIESTEFAGQTVPTDPAPEMVTGGTARVAGFDYGIYRRDGDGENAPKKEFFRDRLQKFMEKMNPKDYVCKMVQVGPAKTLLVMNRSYAHYMAEEMRLFPQFEVSPEELQSLEPDAISFMGIPKKVMGENYKIGCYMEEDSEGKQIPVSWVDAEQFTDYVGYLKKPILTVANECVKESGGMPVHGSAFTIVFKNGLRKTLVIGGDSGAGKSETIIAMVEQMIKEEGEAKDVESIEMLAGDMLSMYEGGDGQVYMLGTEEGDFMRMSDISDDWQKRFRDRLEKASTTNKKHPTNPRTTIGGLCDPNVFLRPVRVNMFYYIDNYTMPNGPSFEEVKSPRTLLMDIYAKGYRREKGTSGDQPNLEASLLDTNIARRDEILRHYGKELDELLGWQISLAETGKVKNAILSFRDRPKMMFRANAIVKDMFEGCTFADDEGGTWTIKKTDYDPKKNHYRVQIADESGSEKTVVLNRSIFDKVYNPVASTYCGNPFIYPGGMDEVLERFSSVMEKAGVITGVLYSKLAVPGEQFDGPAQASRDTIGFIQRDPRINERFQKNQQRVHDKLRRKYGDRFVGRETLPDQLKAYNLLLLERHESDTIKFVDKQKRHIDAKTPHYRYSSTAAKKKFNPSLITPEISAAINAVMDSNDYKRISLEKFEPNMSLYPATAIKTWDSKEELIYQIMMINGTVRIGDDYNIFRKAPIEVKKATVIADRIIAQRAGEAV